MTAYILKSIENKMNRKQGFELKGSPVECLVDKMSLLKLVSMGDMLTWCYDFDDFNI